MNLGQSETWVQAIPRQDLNTIHHALRMLVTHPMVRETTEAAEIEALADRLWDESVRRAA